MTLREAMEKYMAKHKGKVVRNPLGNDVEICTVKRSQLDPAGKRKQLFGLETVRLQIRHSGSKPLIVASVEEQRHPKDETLFTENVQLIERFGDILKPAWNKLQEVVAEY